jgi:hypothetical protein
MGRKKIDEGSNATGIRPITMLGLDAGRQVVAIGEIAEHYILPPVNIESDTLFEERIRPLG